MPDDFAAVATGPVEVAPEPSPEPGGDPFEAEPAFHARDTRGAASGRPSRRKVAVPADHGPVRAPRSIEKTFGESLGYPLWCWSSVAMLGFLPPALAFVSTPLPFLLRVLFRGSALQVTGLILLIPSTLAGVLVWGYTLVFLGQVLTSSAFGEALPPRLPNVQDEGVVRVLGRWFWAIVAGFGLGVVPAVAYWINCGEVDWMDRLMFANLAAIGAAYAQMALLAALLHDDPLAANPITVGKAILRIGWDYAGISLLSGGFLGLMAVSLGALTFVTHPLLFALLTWLYWVAFLYGAMVVLRRLGLFCRRHRVVLAWFSDRPTWGK